MPINPTYSVGTVTVSANGLIVTGSGTQFVAAGIEAGDIFEHGGLTVTIQSADSATQLTLVKPWPGGALSGAVYEIRFTPDALRVLASARAAIADFEAVRPDVELVRSSLPFASRAAAMAASIPAGVRQIEVAGLRFQEDATGNALETAGSRRWSPLGIATPQHWGAVGNGLADDTAAVQAALSAKVLDWGTGTYRVTAGLVASTSQEWRAYSARIVLDAQASIQRAVYVDLPSAGKFVSQGGLTIDAGRMAYTGLWINASGVAAPASVSADGISVRNTYRAGLAFDGGGGIRVAGRFSSVTFDRPRISGAHMAPGAGVSGSQGVTGINVRCAAWAGGGNLAAVTIRNPDIRDVSSEDATWTADQDGIIVWTDRDATTAPVETVATISGGFFRNCWGRAVKVQTERAFVRDTAIVRDTGPSVAAQNPDIDVQVGGGVVSGVNAHYNGFCAQNVVNVSAPTNTSKALPEAIIENVQVTIVGNPALLSVIQNVSRDLTRHILRVRNVSVRGAHPTTVRFNGANGGVFHCFMDGIDAAPSTALVQSGTGTATGHVRIRNCINTGAVVPIFNRASSSFSPTVSCEGVFGWADDPFVSATAQNFTRIGTIVGQDVQGGGATIRSYVIANGDTVTLPRRSVATNFSGLFLVSVAASRNTQALCSGDTSAVSILAQPAAEFVSGAGTEPASGNWRLWASASGYNITNRSGASRTVTVLMFG